MRSSWSYGTSSIAALFLSALLLVSPAQGTTFSTDNSDLWFAHDETGWGMQLVQRADVMFATIYVYDGDGVPTFYSTTLVPSGTTASGDSVWVGDLYLTHGPWFGSPSFDSLQVGYRKVGQMTYTGQYVDASVLSYTVDGVVVNKDIYRYTLKLDDYSGSYAGAFKTTATRCFDSADDGTQMLFATFFVVSETPRSLAMVVNSSAGVSCTYPGDFQQFGQFGQSSGSFACTNGGSGNYTLLEMNVSQSDFRGRLEGTNDSGCAISGTFSGLRQ